MSEPFIGEIRMFAGTFAPLGWAFCDGQFLAVAANDALFSLLGTTYGGDGRTSFGLPDLRGRIPVHQGSGPGLSPRQIGSMSGTEAETLNVLQIPSHDHGARMVAVSTPADTASAIGHQFAQSVGGPIYHTGTGRGSKPATMNANAMASSGGNQPHHNLAPTLCLHFIISLYGIYPSRS